MSSDCDSLHQSAIISSVSQQDHVDEQTRLLKVTRRGESHDIHDTAVEPYSVHLYRFLRNIVPVFIGNLLQQPAKWIMVYTAGHLGSTALAALSLAQIFENGATYISVYALESGISTLCAQTWTAANDKTLTSVHLQRGLIIFALMCFPISITWYTASYILGLLQQEPDIAHQAQLYLQYQFPGFVAYGVYTFIQVFLEAQGVMSALVYAMIISLPFNILFNYILVYGEPFSLEIRGLSIALTLTSVVILGAVVLYAAKIRGYHGWHNWTRQSLQGWSPLLRLYIPSCFVQICNTCVQEATILLISYLGKVELAAQTILLRTHLTMFALGYSIQIVSANTIGNAIGGGSPVNTRRAFAVGGLVAMVASLLIVILLMATRSSFPYWFTDDHLVAQAVVHVLPVFMVTEVTNMFSALGTGTLQGLGYQKVTAGSMFITYFAIVGPLGYVCITLGWIEYSLSMLWTGIGIGHILVAVAQLVYILKLDWLSESEKVHMRIQIAYEQQRTTSYRAVHVTNQ